MSWSHASKNLEVTPTASTAAAERWPLIVHLGWQDIRQRYRRSTLGPSWLTISLAVQVATMGFVYGGLFRLDVSIYLPHLAAGITIWALMSSMITEGCNCFIASEAYLKQLALPKAIFPATPYCSRARLLRSR